MRGIVAKRLRSQDASGRYEPWLAEKIRRTLGKRKFAMLKASRNFYRTAKRLYHGSR